VKTCKLNYKVRKDLSLASRFRGSQILTKFWRISPQIEIGGNRIWGKSPTRREKKKKNSFFFFFFCFWWSSNRPSLERRNCCFRGGNGRGWKHESCSSKRRWQKERQRDRSWRTETDGSKRSETRETTKRNLFGGRTLQRGQKRKGRSCDVGCHQASSYKCIPSFTEPTLSFTGLYPPVFALPEFETDDSSHLRSTVNRRNKV